MCIALLKKAIPYMHVLSLKQLYLIVMDYCLLFI